MFVFKKHLCLRSDCAKARLQSIPETKSRVKLTLPSFATQKKNGKATSEKVVSESKMCTARLRENS